MTPLDATFLHAEDAEPNTSLAIASIAVFAGPVPRWDRVRAHLAGRLPLVPRYRQKVREVPFDLAAPVWVDDPSFELDHHLVRTALPAPGDDRQLCALMGRVMSARLDRDRPLWQCWLVEGLHGGRWALITKVHHCMVDGISGTDLYRVLLDPTPATGPAAPDAWRPRPEPSAARLTRDAAGELAALPLRQARAAGALLRHPADSAARLTRLGRGALALAAGLRPAAPSSLSGPLARPRHYGRAGAATRTIAEIRRGFGGTFNDVVLAAVAGGFRALLLERGEEPTAASVRTLVPVSVRPSGQESVRDNRVSLLLARLPVHLDDPVERLRAVSDELVELKAGGESDAGTALYALAGYLPYPLVAGPVRVLAGLPQHSVVTVVTNVPGPRAALYALGRELLEVVPYVPITSSMRIGVSVFSYRDRVTFGLTADESADDLEVLGGAIEEDLWTLRSRAGAGARSAAADDGRRGPGVPQGGRAR